MWVHSSFASEGATRLKLHGLKKQEGWSSAWSSGCCTGWKIYNSIVQYLYYSSFQSCCDKMVLTKNCRLLHYSLILAKRDLLKSASYKQDLILDQSSKCHLQPGGKQTVMPEKTVMHYLSLIVGFGGVVFSTESLCQNHFISLWTLDMFKKVKKKSRGFQQKKGLHFQLLN